jgi:hypothetical protein
MTCHSRGLVLVLLAAAAIATVACGRTITAPVEEAECHVFRRDTSWLYSQVPGVTDSAMVITWQPACGLALRAASVRGQP